MLKILTVMIVNLLLLLLLLNEIDSDSSSVSYCSEFDNIETSSTLQWTQTKNDRVFDDAVIVTGHRYESNDLNQNEDIYICGALISNLFLVGQTVDNHKYCIAPDLDKRIKSDNYRYLRNIENGSRLEWVPWNSFESIPKGSIVIEESIDKLKRNFIARKSLKYANTNVSYYAIGMLIYKDGFGDIMVVNETEGVETHNNGELLIEKQPISYDMKNVEFIKNKEKVKRKNITLGHIVLANNEQGSSANSRVDSLISYDYHYKSTWGQGHAIKTVLPVSIILKNGTLVSKIQWAIDQTENKTGLFQIEAYLDPGTAVNVTLTGSQLLIETPYQAELVTNYVDAVKLYRTIKDVRILETVAELETHFSYAYFISNLSMVPPVTTTMTPQSTYTILSSTSNNPGEIQKTIAVEYESDENENDLESKMLLDQESSSLRNVNQSSSLSLCFSTSLFFVLFLCQIL